MTFKCDIYCRVFSRPWGDIADLPLLKKVVAESCRSQFLESDGLICFISIGKFGSFKNPLAIITSLSEFHYFKYRRLSPLKQTTEVIDRRTSSCEPWRWIWLDMIFMMGEIYINSNLDLITKVSGSSRSTEFKDIHPWNISQMMKPEILMLTSHILMTPIDVTGFLKNTFLAEVTLNILYHIQWTTIFKNTLCINIIPRYFQFFI